MVYSQSPSSVTEKAARRKEKAELFGLGFQEIVVIVILAVLLLGPKKIPEVAQTVGKLLRDLQHAADDVKKELARPVEDLKREMSKPVEDMKRQLSGQVDDIKKELTNSVEAKSKVLETNQKITTADSRIAEKKDKGDSKTEPIPDCKVDKGTHDHGPDGLAG